MPIAYTILQEPAIHLVSYHGTVTNEDFLTSYKAASVDPRYRPGMVEISDLRHADVIDIDIDAIKAFVAWVAGRKDLAGSTLRSGILLGNDMQAGMSRLYEAVANIHTQETVRRFRDLPALLSWLAVDPVHTDRIAAALEALAHGEVETPARTRVDP